VTERWHSVSSKLEFQRGETIAEKYEVVDLIDESPLGVSYRVKHLKTGRYIRLTLLRPTIAGREQKDAILAAYKAAKSVQHPNLVKLGELGEHNGVAYLTYEDFEGTTLRELMQEYKIAGRDFGVKEAAQVTKQILDAAAAVNASGQVFRALRPEYVLVNVRYTGPRRQTFLATCKVFGACFWDLVPSATLAEDEFTRGEAQYLAPELKSFEPVPTERSDIYSVGVILYEMLVGSAPVGTFQLPRSRRPELPQHVNTVVELALAQAPEDRYQTSLDFATDLQRTFQNANLEKSEKKPLISALGWGLMVAIVALFGLILYNLQSDPVKVALAKDSQLRQQMMEEHDRPSSAELKQIESQHPANMVYIPAGPYISGRLHSEESVNTSAQEPLAEVTEVDAFLIDIFEYPNTPGAPPKTEVGFTDAETLCATAGKRLCSASEWEKACKGPRNLVYSYGDAYDPEYCGEGVEDTYASGDRTECKTDWRAFDMSGNHREWTNTVHRKETRRIVKGGIRSNPVKGTRCAPSTDESVGFNSKTLSFRCCRDADAPPLEK
jgi:serine/threonine protein kinase